jgi:type VI secretion system FHA domain protein
MLLIRAISFKGQPLPRDVSARFDESGGTIGRGEHSTLVLPDPERYISRTHATIAFQAGGFVITDNGTKNPVLLNGRPLGSGSQGRLGSGDRIKLGDYILEVALTASATPPAGAGAAGISAPAKDDPLAPFGGPAPGGSDPFADLLRPPARPTPPIEIEAGIARPPAPPVRPVAPLPPDILDILRGPEPKIDNLFDLQAPPRPDVLRSGAAPGNPLVPSQPADSFDLRDVLGLADRPVPRPTVPDHGPEIFTPYVPPAARPNPVAEAASREAPPGPVPPDVSAVPPPMPRGVSAPLESVTPGGSLDPAQPPAASGSPGDDALLRALLQGAGIGDARVRALTPEMMESIGQLLREAIQGTLDLLRARGLTKSEMGADVTMIMPLDNNPLKFSPTVGAALIHLLAPSMPGFMPPVRAMRGAYDDLRAHQVGFLAGMRAALDEVLARFAPDELEKRLSDPTVLDSVLPMSRRAKLWDLFVQRYGDVAGEAREDFNAAFGKAFRRAYDAQVRKLRTEGT